MAILNPSVDDVQILKAPGAVDDFGIALVTFTVTGTYAQADNLKLLAVASLISGSTRNGKTVTMIAVGPGQHTYRSSDGTAMAVKTVAISTNDVTMELAKSTTAAYGSTEFDDGTAVPTMVGPLGILVVYTEA